MPSYEENMQVVLDLRAQVLDPNKPDPSPEEVYAAVQALHATRGAAQKKKSANKVVIKDLKSLFAKPEEEQKDEASNNEG
jgi:hypothetical protein